MGGGGEGGRERRIAKRNYERAPIIFECLKAVTLHSVDGYDDIWIIFILVDN